MPSKALSIGAQIDALHTLREKKRAAEEVVKALAKDIDAAQVALMERMEKEGMPKASGQYATVTLGSAVVPDVVDWDEFYKFIKRHNYFHLLERRPSVLGCRELFETKGKIPGVEPFTKKSLNLRSAG